MSKITVFSLDYDGCADVLFRGDSFRKESFKNYLTEIATGSLFTEVYVGSLRQDHATDQHNIKRNGPGSCFENLSTFCDEKSWRFQKLLLADIENGLPAGSAIDNPNIKCHKYLSTNTKKIKIIEHQLRDLAIRHPFEEIDFYFIDDDPRTTMLPAIINYFKEYPEKIPANLSLFLIQYKSRRGSALGTEIGAILSSEKIMEMEQALCELYPEFEKSLAGQIANQNVFVKYQYQREIASDSEISPEEAISSSHLNMFLNKLPYSRARLNFLIKFEDMVKYSHDVIRFMYKLNDEDTLEFVMRHSDKIDNIYDLDDILRKLRGEEQLKFAMKKIGLFQDISDLEMFGPEGLFDGSLSKNQYLLVKNHWFESQKKPIWAKLFSKKPTFEDSTEDDLVKFIDPRL